MLGSSPVWELKNPSHEGIPMNLSPIILHLTSSRTPLMNQPLLNLAHLNFQADMDWSWEDCPSLTWQSFDSSSSRAPPAWMWKSWCRPPHEWADQAIPQTGCNPERGFEGWDVTYVPFQQHEAAGSCNHLQLYWLRWGVWCCSQTAAYSLSSLVCLWSLSSWKSLAPWAKIPWESHF